MAGYPPEKSPLGAAIVAMTPAQQRGILHSMFERIEIDETGEVSGFKPRAWVRHAFAELLNAWEKLPTMTPTGVGIISGISLNSDTTWLVSLMAE